MQSLPSGLNKWIKMCKWVAASLFPLLVLLLSAAGSDPLPRAKPETVGLSQDRLEEATALLSRFVAEHKIAGAVAAVARKGRLAYLEAVGFQDLETRRPMTDRSLFRIYSMTKSATAVAV